MKCKKHPKYKAIREPRSCCAQCWEMWNSKRFKNRDKDEKPRFGNPEVYPGSREAWGG